MNCFKVMRLWAANQYWRACWAHFQTRARKPAAAPTVTMADIQTDNSATAAPIKAKRAPGRPKRSASTAALDAAPVPAAAPVAPATTTNTTDATTAPAKKRGGRTKKVVDAVATTDAAAAAAPSDAAAAPKKKSVPPTYIEGYGDSEKAYEEQKAAITEEDHLAFKTAWNRRINKQTFPQWAKAKLAYIRKEKAVKDAAAKRSRAKLTVTFPEKIAAYNAKLSTLPPAAFAPLNGGYVSDYGKFGKIDAAELTGKTPLTLSEGAGWASSVYFKAVEAGVQPAGIVDSNRKLKQGTKKADKQYEFLTEFAGPRKFVGVVPKYEKEPIVGLELVPELSFAILKGNKAAATATASVGAGAPA